MFINIINHYNVLSFCLIQIFIELFENKNLHIFFKVNVELIVLARIFIEKSILF